MATYHKKKEHGMMSQWLTVAGIFQFRKECSFSIKTGNFLTR